MLFFGHVNVRVLPLPLLPCEFMLSTFGHLFCWVSLSLRSRFSQLYDSAICFSIYSSLFWPLYSKRWQRSNHLPYWSPMIIQYFAGNFVKISIVSAQSITTHDIRIMSIIIRNIHKNVRKNILLADILWSVCSPFSDQNLWRGPDMPGYLVQFGLIQ